MAMHTHYGRWAEGAAAAYLQQKGYHILHQNWRFERYELDIVASNGYELIVVEVKARATSYFQRPPEAVGLEKQRRIVAATDAYIAAFGVTLPVRYDIVGVIGKEELSIEHIEHAFVPLL